MPEVQIAVAKGGKDAFVVIDTDKIPQEVYEAALLEGLKTFINKKMTKVTKKDIPDEKQRQDEAILIATQNVEDLMEGKIGRARKAKTKAPGAVMTEARRLAKALVKDEMKRQG